eukprot:TRINITY_DN27379_c0_g1_i1.p1 TRINITY_DN27379_c0_g1~~TRINITY_DN27379_c0_g1_i1.p1  ORF type:complete len:274 (-),score=20.41 TRINITY_DN27379_c0_g1_i1:71-892(-)
MLIVWQRLLLCLLCTAWITTASINPVIFAVGGKIRNSKQDVDGRLSVIRWDFFVEIYINEHSAQLVTNVTVRRPDSSKPIVLPSTGQHRETIAGEFHTQDELDKQFPDGVYTFQWSTKPKLNSRVAAVQHKLPLTIQKLHPTDYIPRQAVFTLKQHGLVKANRVRPHVDLHVSWTKFTNGGPDPNHIVPEGDLVFFYFGTLAGKPLIHTAVPFEGKHPLSFRNSSFVVPGRFLKPNSEFSMWMEQAKLMTTKKAGVAGLGTFSAATYINITTL